jgi:hypothetical protein
VKSSNTLKQYIRSLHKIQQENGGGGQGVFESRETNEVTAQVVEILDGSLKELKVLRTRYNCEEDGEDEGVISFPARLLLPVCFLVV